jgi:magnesium transporter
MLNIFTLANGRLFQEEIESLEELSRFQPIWVDLESPTLEEKRWIKQYFGLLIPEDAMDEDIEESARFYEEDNGELHIRSDFLIADDDEPRTVRCAFILNQHNADLKSQGVLFSIHDEDVPVFRLLRMRARRAPGLIEDAKEVLLKLFDADAEYSADTLEGIYDQLEKVGNTVLSGDVTDAMASEVLGAIARQEDMNGRIRRNVMDTRRALSFIRHFGAHHEAQGAACVHHVAAYAPVHVFLPRDRAQHFTGHGVCHVARQHGVAHFFELVVNAFERVR